MEKTAYLGFLARFWKKIDLNDIFENHFELIYLHDVVRIIFLFKA